MHTVSWHDRPALRRARAEGLRRQRIMRQVTHRLVFIYKTFLRAGLSRQRGRAPKGQHLTVVAPFGRWQTQTLIACLTREALIAPRVIPGALDRAVRDASIET